MDETPSDLKVPRVGRDDQQGQQVVLSAGFVFILMFGRHEE